jgi:hypothetical protein
MRQDPEGAIILTKTEALKLIVERDGMIHTFLNNPTGLLGADHDKKSIIESIDNAKELQLAGAQAQGFKHALAIIPHIPFTQSQILFVETKPEEVEKLNKKVKQ